MLRLDVRAGKDILIRDVAKGEGRAPVSAGGSGGGKVVGGGAIPLICDLGCFMYQMR